MLEKVNMKKIKYLDKFLSGYLVLSGVLSLFFLIVIFLDQELDVTFLIAIFFSLTLILAVIIYNVKIFISYSVTKERTLVNSISAFLQTVYIAVDGFQFKYMQGIELLFYAKKYTGTPVFKFGLDFEKFSYLILVKFRDLDYTSIGVDLLALFLFIFYLNQYRKIKSIS